DTRMYAKFAQIPCLDPKNIQQAHDMMVSAFDISEKYSLPVIFRPTTRICHSKSDVVLGQRNPSTRTGKFIHDPSQYVVIPAHTRPLHTKLTLKQSDISQYLVKSGYNSANIRGSKAIIASGISISYIEEILPKDISLIQIGAYPIDLTWLSEIVNQHSEILVVEELMPIVEESVRQVSVNTVIHGKMDGSLPYEGEFSSGLN
ncbi:MAG TPA: indolepyruvate ferredoxin oxidoreductase subunit alpha, partial [Methanocorpusculum sp.]|nr:indolepyruvate ferredoxin oxidoreductase subunit alpha [Methanocorpusculum sp.]